MTTKKDLEDLLDSIITSDSFESADKAKKLKKVWSEDYDKKGSTTESDGDSDGYLPNI